MALPLLPAAIGLSAVADFFGGKATNDANAVEAQKNRDFQDAQGGKAYDRGRTMRQTAYQDTVADMQKAGLNPLLAYQQGATSGGAGPSGGSVGNPTMENSVGHAVGTAMSGARMLSDLQTAQADRTLKHAEALTEVARAEREKTSSHLNEEEIHNLALRSKQTGYQDEAVKSESSARVKESGARGKEAEARENRAKLDLENDARERILNQIGQGAGIVTNAAGAYGRMKGRGGPPVDAKIELPPGLDRSERDRAIDSGYRQGYEEAKGRYRK